MLASVVLISVLATAAVQITLVSCKRRIFVTSRPTRLVTFLIQQRLYFETRSETRHRTIIRNVADFSCDENHFRIPLNEVMGANRNVPRTAAVTK